MFIVFRKEQSRSKNAVNKIAYYPAGMLYKTRKGAEKEALRLDKLYKVNAWHRGCEVQEFDWDKE